MGWIGSRRSHAFIADDGGASAVEFALLLPLFVMLTIGTISAGFAFHTWLSVTHGAQESSRFAATLSVKASAPGDGGTVATWLDEVSSRAAAAANVDVTSAAPGTYICVAVVSSSNVPPLNHHMIMEAGPSGVMAPSAALSGSCPELDSVAGDYVQTYVAEPVQFNYVLGSTQITVAGTSVSRYEAVSLS